MNTTGCPVLREEGGRLVTCSRGLANTTVCRACLGDLAGWLRRTPGLAEDLLVTLARQDHVAVAQPGGSTEQPLPFNVRASEALEDLRRVVGWWARETAPDASTGPLRPFSGIRDAAADLLAQLPVLAVHPDAEAAVSAVREAVTEGLAAVDHPVVLLWLGVCRAEVYDVHSTDVVGQCLGDLYAQADDDTVRCRTCGATHDARSRRWAVLIPGLEKNLNAADLARLARAYGVAVTAGKVRLMGSRHQITATGTDPAGFPVYRVGDVLDVLRERAEQQRTA